jgi:hypothetical protein
VTAKELVSKLRAQPQMGLSVIFSYLADHVYEARLSFGTRPRLNDAGDFQAWLRELSEAAQIPGRAVDKTCPRCGHIHQAHDECGEELGGGRICRCEMSVPAA